MESSKSSLSEGLHSLLFTFREIITFHSGR